MTTVKDRKFSVERARTIKAVGPQGTVRVSIPSSSTAHSIFHEPWWLDIATQGNWKLAVVKRNNEIIGEMPYSLTRMGLWRVSHLPPLTRTLGPAIKPVTGSASRQMHHRLDVTMKLIDQLPDCDSFFQLFDSRIDDALAFALRGFTVSARYTFQIDGHGTAEEAWASLGSKIRNVIRSAERQLTVAPIATPREFVSFYDANLAARLRTNAYGSAVMHQLVTAFLERQSGTLLGAYGPGGKLVAAIGLVWDHRAMYYLLSSRAHDAHSGAVSLLIWMSRLAALERKLTFDFDGFSSPSTFKFLDGFGATLTQRLGVERHGTTYSVARVLKRRLTSGASAAFEPNL